MISKPALLGGSPVFSQKLQFVKPVLPRYPEIAEEIRELLESGMVTKGRHLERLEDALARHLCVKHAVAVSSCTSGLMLTYRAFGLRDEVVVPSFTFMATIGALVWAGARPVFADVDSPSMNVDPESVAAAITSNTEAIVAVHNFGNPADIDRLQDIADRKGVRLILDAAHGFGSLFSGRPLGAQGDAQIFSMSPSKLLIAGEGGVVATNNEALAEKIRIGREYGNGGDYNSLFAGVNARLPELSALMARHSLVQVEEAVCRRNAIAEIYRRRLGELPGISFQDVMAGNRSSFTYFAIKIDAAAFGLTRDELALALAAENVDTRKYYDPPAHLHAAYEEYSASRLGRTERLSACILSLPIWSAMDDSIVTRVCDAIEKTHAGREQIKGEMIGSLVGAAG